MISRLLAEAVGYLELGMPQDAWDALEEIPAAVLETIEAEFLGGQAPLDGVLAEYVQGRLDKKSMKPRARYASVLDLKRLKDDIRMNLTKEDNRKILA